MVSSAISCGAWWCRTEWGSCFRANGWSGEPVAGRWGTLVAPQRRMEMVRQIIVQVWIFGNTGQ